ncbi:MAG: hypothetical protein AAF871_09620 [Pseudomonadota bacterium]
MRRMTAILLLLGGFGLGACGDTLGEQALIGGAAGAGVSAATNGDILTGAALGAAGNVAYCQTYPGRC